MARLFFIFALCYNAVVLNSSAKDKNESQVFGCLDRNLVNLYLSRAVQRCGIRFASAQPRTMAWRRVMAHVDARRFIAK